MTKDDFKKLRVGDWVSFQYRDPVRIMFAYREHNFKTGLDETYEIEATTGETMKVVDPPGWIRDLRLMQKG